MLANLSLIEAALQQKYPGKDFTALLDLPTPTISGDMLRKEISDKLFVCGLSFIWVMKNTYDTPSELHYWNPLHVSYSPNHSGTVKYSYADSITVVDSKDVLVISYSSGVFSVEWFDEWQEKLLYHRDWKTLVQKALERRFPNYSWPNFINFVGTHNGQFEKELNEDLQKCGVAYFYVPSIKGSSLWRLNPLSLVVVEENGIRKLVYKEKGKPDCDIPSSAAIMRIRFSSPFSLDSFKVEWVDWLDWKLGGIGPSLRIALSLGVSEAYDMHYKSEDKKCTCPIDVLMQAGCKCGAMQREKS